MGKTLKFFALVAAIQLVGCANLLKKKEANQSEQKAAAVKSVEADVDPASLDPVQLKSQAEYHFAMGETYSLESLSAKAAEQFKLTLVYDPDSATVRMKLAVEYVKMGLISEAIEQVDSVLEKNPKNAEAHMLLGGLYSSIKVFDKSEEHYLKVVQLDTDKRAEAQLYLGAVYAEQEQYPKSFEMFTAVSKDKNVQFHHLAHYYMGRLYGQTGEKKKAIKELQKSLSLKPDFDDAVLVLSDIYERSQQTEKSKKLLASFQDQHGPSVDVAKTLGQMYLEAEDYEKAYTQYEIIQAAEPQNLSVKVRLALISIERKEYEKSIYKLKEILTASPELDKVRFYLAAVYEEMKNYSDAIAQFNLIPPTSQFYGESKVHSAYLTKVSEDSQKAILVIEDALKNKSDYPQFYALYASLLDDVHDFKKAEAVLVSAVQKFPGDDQLQFFLGSIQDKLGKKQETIVTMKRVLQLNEKHFQAMNYLAYTYAEMNVELDQAEALSRQALALNPGDAYIRDTFGWVLYKKGRISEAVKVLEAAHKSQPNESIIAEHLGDAYYQFQLFQKARDMYQKAVSVEKDQDNAEKIRGKISQIEQISSRPSKTRQPASVAPGN